MNTVAVIDYGMGNLRSVYKAIEHVGQNTRVILSHDAAEILSADRIVVPGQGAARDCMSELKRLELDAVIKEAVRSKPMLGICMGLQVLLDFSDENEGTRCLGILPGRVRRFTSGMRDDDGAPLKIPHMGWNQVRQDNSHPLWRNIAQDSRFYFVHSYYVEPAAAAQIAAHTHYGVDFVCAMAHENMFAVQFHPEKSSRAGLALLYNFMTWDGNA